MKKNFSDYITGLQHIGIPTKDYEGTVAFYKALGFQIAHETVNEKTNERVVFLQFENLMIEAYESADVALKDGAVDHIALNVTDIEPVFELAKEAGYQILDGGIQALPFWENGVKYFIILGPNKEKVEFNQYL